MGGESLANGGSPWTLIFPGIHAMGEAILAHAVGVSGGSNGSGGPVEEAIKRLKACLLEMEAQPS